MGVTYFGAAVVARHRAQGAADLGALAAATSVMWGDGEPCERARVIVGRQEGAARMTSCALDGEDAVVSVVVDVRLGRWGVREATAQARAGPTEPE